MTHELFSLFKMSFYMLIQAILQCIQLATMITLKLLLFRMKPFVYHYCSLSSETLTTFITLKLLFSCMLYLVSLQTTVTSKLFATYQTLIVYILWWRGRCDITLILYRDIGGSNRGQTERLADGWNNNIERRWLYYG